MEVNIKIRATALEKKVATPLITKIAEDLAANGSSSIRVIIAKDERGTMKGYFEEPDKEHVLGMVKCDNMGDLETIIEYDYECKVSSVDGSELTATVKTLGEATAPKKVAGSTNSGDFKDMVDEGFMTEADLAKRLEIAEDHGVSAKTMRKVFDEIKARGIKKEISPLRTAYVNPEKGEKVQGRYFYNAVFNCLTRSAFILEGPKSVGKNVFCSTLAYLFNLEYFVIQLNENTSDGDVYGEKSTDNSAAGAMTMEMALAKMAADTAIATGKAVDDATAKLAAEFEYYKAQASSVKIIQAIGVWVQWLQRGGIMCLNEMDMADPNFFSMLVNMILDGTGFMTVPGYGRVDVHPDCILVGTQNGEEYAGTNNQNTASISRFDKYILPQPKSVLPQLKSACKGEGFSIEDRYLIACNELYKDLAKKASMDGFEGAITDTCLNIRGMVRALKAVAVSDYELKLKDRLVISVVNACNADERPLIMQSLNERVAC